MPIASPRTALCLSGGGFRALHWHLGSLRALNARGWLARVDTISGVSAGAVCASWLGLRWGELCFDKLGSATNLDELVIAPLRAFTQLRIGIPAALASFAMPLGWANAALARDLDRLLYRGARLADLTAAPEIVLNAVQIDTADAVRFRSGGAVHPIHGRAALPGLPLAAAVAASCGFPPFFAPAIIPTPGAAWERGPGPTRLLLGDGVLEDNTGLEAVWPDHGLLLLSDASLPCKWPSTVHPLWHSILLHTQRVQFHHGRLSRLTRLREQFAAGLREGAYWGLSGEWFGAAGQAGEDGSRAVTNGNAQAATDKFWRIPSNFLRLRPDIQEALEGCSGDLFVRALAALDTPPPA